MRFRSNLIASLAAVIFGAAVWGEGAFPLGAHYWPTPNPAFVRGQAPETYLQPTVSGELNSALFGCVRNNGRRFHEGLDLKPIGYDRRGEAIDPIFAFHRGVVRHVNHSAGSSGYGRYVVIEHPEIAPGLVTLYSHLRSIDEWVVPGVEIEGGRRFAIMGRSAGGYSIPKERAHLHFEVAFWLGPNFQRWFDGQGFGSANEHGSYNGMNIVGLDVWALVQDLRSGAVRDVREFLASEPVAVEAYIRSASIPELLQVNPHLMHNLTLPADHVGWKVEVTWYGLPVRFEALSESEMIGSRWLEVQVTRPDLLMGRACFDLASSSGSGSAGPKLQSLMRRLFLD